MVRLLKDCFYLALAITVTYLIHIFALVRFLDNSSWIAFWDMFIVIFIYMFFKNSYKMFEKKENE